MLNLSLMRKIVVSLALATLITSTVSYSAFGAAKAGTKCTKSGDTSIVSGKKFTCIKSGKKLVWDKGVALELAPTSFENLLTNYKGIPAAAWASAQKNIATSKIATPELEVVIGPKTKLPYNKSIIEGALKKATAIFKEFPQPPKQTALFYNFMDLKWATESLSKFRNPFKTSDTYADQAIEHCPNEMFCRGAFGNYAEGTGLIINSVATPDGQWIDYFDLSGAQDIHEFTHTIQKAQFLTANKETHFGYPQWFSEGQPQVAGFTGANNTLDKYKEMRLKVMDAPAKGLGGYSPSDISRFYVLQGISSSDPETKNLVYSIGYITVEALTALKGIDSTMNLVKEVASGKTFEEAFKKIYDIEWVQAEPILAQVVSKQFLEVRKYATNNG